MSPKDKKSCPVEGCDYVGTERGLRMHLRYHSAEEQERAQEALAGASPEAPVPAPAAKPAPPAEAPAPAPAAEPADDVASEAGGLEDAFHSECVDFCTYDACAEVATRDAFHGTAKLFRMAAAMERVHIRRMIYSLGALSDSTAENMRKAVASEQEDVATVLPGYLARARAMGAEGAADLFEQIISAETRLRDLLRDALTLLDQGRDIRLESYWVCEVCGAPAVGLPPGQCEVCGAPHRKFEAVG